MHPRSPSVSRDATSGTDVATGPGDDAASAAPATPQRRTGYAAFLSYGRIPDGGLAVALQRELERFAKPWNQRRALRVFRDDTNLSANSDLWSSIAAALDSSEYLILLASPESARSPWVRREMEHWLSRRPSSTVLVAVTDGELVWSGAGFDPARTTCLPEPLLRAFRTEPRWVDLRPLRGRTELDPRLPAFRDAVVDLAAPLRHVAKDDLVGEDLRQFRRTRRLVRAAVAVLATLTLLASVAAVVAVRQTAVADQQRGEAVSQQRAALGRELLGRADGARAADPRRAIRYALAAQRLDPGDAATASLVTTVTGTRIEASLPAHTDLVRAVATSPDSRTLATGSRNGAVTLWDITDPARPAQLDSITWEPAVDISSVAFSPDGRTLAISTAESTVELWSTAEVHHVAKLGVFTAHDGPVSALAWAPDGRTLVTGGYDTHVTLWDVENPAAVVARGRPLTAYRGKVNDLAFTPDGRTLFSAGSDNLLIAWRVTDPARPTLLGRPLSAESAGVDSVSVSADGRLLATTGPDKGTLLWDIADPARPRQIGTGLGAGRNLLVDSRFAPSGRLLVSTTTDRVVRLWDVTDPQNPTVRDELAGHGGAVTALGFAPAGLVVSGSVDGTVILWKAIDQTRAGTAGVVPGIGNGRGLATVAFAPDGLLAVTGTDHAVALWDVHDPARPRPVAPPLPGHGDSVWSMAFSPDGRILASGSYDDSVRLWDVADPAHPAALGAPLTGHDDDVQPVRFSPDGRLLASGSQDGSLILWDVGDPRHPRQLHRERPRRDNLGITALTFAPHGRTLVITDLATFRTYDVTDPEQPTAVAAAPIVHLGPVSALQFSPDGRVLASGSEDGTVLLWDLTDPARPRVLGPPLRTQASTENPANGVVAVAFAPDGRSLAMGTVDSAVELWDVTHPAYPARLGRASGTGDGPPLALAFSPDGRQLAVPGHYGAVLADVVPSLQRRDQAVDRACTIAGGGLTAAEWADLVPGIGFEPTCPDPPVR